MPLSKASKSIVVHEATDVLTSPLPLIDVGKSVIVYRGGETGCETAEFLAERGIDVKLVTRSALHELARGAEPMYRRELRARAVRAIDDTGARYHGNVDRGVAKAASTR